MLGRMAGVLGGLVLAGPASAATYSDYLAGFTQTTLNAAQGDSISGSIDFNSLVDGVNVVSGEYFITDASIGFSFSQSAYINSYDIDNDFAFSNTVTDIPSAHTEQLLYQGTQYDYVVDVSHTDYYYDQRADARATVDLTGGLLSPTTTRTTSFPYSYAVSNTLDGVDYIVPPDTTGTIERHTSYSSYRVSGTSDSIYYDLDPLSLVADSDGILNYDIVATNAYLDFTAIYLSFDYQLNPNYTPPGSGGGTTVVPVPAAAWLFMSGLVALIGVSRRKS